VRAGAVPVAGDRLRVQGQHNSGNLCDPLQSINSASNQSQSIALHLSDFSLRIEYIPRTLTSRM
jgi:hypothetical protein